MFFFQGEHQEKNISKKGRGISNHISRPFRDLEQGHTL